MFPKRHLISLGKFWSSHPGLLYGLAFLLSLSAAFEWNALLLLPILIVFAPGWFLFTCEKKYSTPHLLGPLLLGLFTYIFSIYNYMLSPLPEEGKEGLALIEINSIFPLNNRFSSSIVYKGKIKEFIDEKTGKAFPIRNAPFSIFLKKKEKKLLTHCSYQVKGLLKKNSAKKSYSLKVKKNAAWIPRGKKRNFAKVRYEAKQFVKKYIRKHIPSPRNASFLSGIATGEFDETTTLFNFGRLGLQHIMAISGFHFSILSFFLNFFLRLFTPLHIGNILLILILSGYFLFLGPQPSIERAWFSQFLFLLGGFFNKKSIPLNALGLSILVVLLSNPFHYENLGFHLSFLTTASIIIFYSGINKLLVKIFEEQTLSQIKDQKPIHQCIYIFNTFLRRNLALALSVNLSIIPSVLYYFHKFPIMGIIYNLFFPFFISLSIILLLLAVFSSLFFPPLSHLFHWINNQYTTIILDTSFQIPSSLDIYWRVKTFPNEIFILYLCALFLLGILLKNNTKQKDSDYLSFL